MPNKYRVLGREVCPCGELFTVTTHAPKQRFCGKQCPKYRAESLAGRMQAAAAKRDRLIHDLIAEHVKPGQRINHADLVTLGRTLYLRGYQGGYHLGRGQRLRAA